MARPEKTVFISYRRKDIAWALAVYQYLADKKYDVFFDYTSISSGDFEQIIASNIKARAHFVLILTPDALDSTSNPEDWLRREIETAIDEKRNIIPLFFDGFTFSSPAVTERLTGKLANISRYNGLDIPSGYFPEAMERLRTRYLNVPLDAVIHPVSSQVRKKVKEEKVAANKALREQKVDIKELVKPVKEKFAKQKRPSNGESPISPSTRWKVVDERISSWFKKVNLRPLGVGIGILLVSALGIFGINSVIQKLSVGEFPSLTQTREPIVETTQSSTRTFPTSTATVHPATSTVTRIVPTKTATYSPTPSPSPTSTLAAMVSPKDGMTLLYVPEGEFIMGSGTDNDHPAHTVYLDAFWIDQTHVTNALYMLCVKASVCNEPSDKSSYTRDNYYGNSEFDNYPVINVSWNDASIYCSWADRRLPTEAEWEKAARGEKAFTYPWGQLNLIAAMNNEMFDPWSPDTTKVGSYPNGASPYGALDMAGNVWEWVNDWYSSDYYANSPPSNPQGPSSGNTRVLRGSSWFSTDSDYSTYTRRQSSLLDSYYIGFRCAMDASE